MSVNTLKSLLISFILYRPFKILLIIPYISTRIKIALNLTLSHFFLFFYVSLSTSKSLSVFLSQVLSYFSLLLYALQNHLQSSSSFILILILHVSLCSQRISLCMYLFSLCLSMSIFFLCSLYIRTSVFSMHVYS